MNKTHCVAISVNGVKIDGKELFVSVSGKEMLKEIYGSLIRDYPKFHKMDLLSQLAFIASELLLEAEGLTRFEECNDRAVILFGHTASYHADRIYQTTISNRKSFFPSPSVFVYTLPNIMVGEIAIRNHYHGETSYIALENKSLMEQYIEVYLKAVQPRSVMYGWIDARDENDFEAELCIIN